MNRKLLTEQQRELLLENLVGDLELPAPAYKKAKDRYEDIGAFLSREQSTCFNHDPHVFPQGSFRVGTAIRPLKDEEEHDLDLACELTQGLNKSTHSQAALKKIVGDDLEKYRDYRQVKAPIEPKHRCWRLSYKDDLSFHIDVVPCIPADSSRRDRLVESMIGRGSQREFASDLAKSAVNITDDRDPNYRAISDDWNISNPEGFAKWFESRMNLQSGLLVEKRAELDALPIYERKTPLQRSVQLLKRHRDVMFSKNPDSKPISVIITTLAGRAYRGERTLSEALSAIVTEISRFAQSGSHEVLNPVNPEENFADRWTMPKYRELKLQENFDLWAAQLEADITFLSTTADAQMLAEHANSRLALGASAARFQKLLGLSDSASAHSPKVHQVSQEAPKPWKIMRQL